MKISFEDLAMQKWNIQTDRAQTVDEKNGVRYWIIMFTARVTVIKMSKIAADGCEKLVIVWVKYLSAPARSYWTLSENGTVSSL